MSTRFPGRGPRARTSAWSPLILAGALGATVIAGPLTASAASAPGVRLTADQVRTLSSTYTVGVSASGTTAARAAAAQAAAAPDATDSAKQLTQASAASTDSSTAPNQNPVSSADALTETNEVETPSGLSLTGTLQGTSDWYRVDTSGQVALVDGSGQPEWTRTEQSFVADWQMKASASYLPVPTQLSMLAGYDPITPGTQVSNDTFATGEFGGDDGDRDIAVAYSVGLNGAFPFTLPGSSLTNEATFVTVLSGRDGHTLWHGVYPGVVTQLVAADGGLLVGNETGPDWGVNPTAAQGDSRSNLSFLTFRAGSGGSAAETTQWTYTRNVPWARWTAVTATPYGIAAAWTDTPIGLGDPRPADGHVILLDARSGKLLFDTSTPGYPRMLLSDPAHGRILAAEENDPTDAVSWQLTAFDPRGGARTVLASREGAVPTTLAAGSGDRGAPAYYASELAFDTDGNATGSTALAFDTAGDVTWSTPVPTAFSGDIPVVGGMVVAPQHHDTLILTTQDPQPATETDPNGPDGAQIMAVDSRTGTVGWNHQGAVATGLVPALQGDSVLSVAADDTAYRYRIEGGALQGVEPLIGDVYAGIQAPAGVHATAALILGGQSRGVFALDATPGAHGTPTGYLWTATVQGAVHQIQAVDGGREVLVTASGGWDLIDTRTGRVVTSVDIPGAYTRTATALQSPSGLEVIVPTHSLTAYDAAGGKRIWSYTPSGDQVEFSNATLDSNGDVIAEYSTADGDASPVAAGVALNAKTGAVRWTVTPSAAVRGAEITNGVYASPYIPVDKGDAVAFAWPGKLNTLVELRDAKTGALVTSTTDGGFITHTGFSAAPGEGLVEAHWAQLTRLAADGTTWSSTDTYPMDYAGSFAESGDGSSVYVTANNGIQAYDPTQISAATDGDFATQFGSTPAIDDSQALTVDGSTVLGFQQDENAYNLGLAWDGMGFYSPDSAIHGVTVNQIGTAPATKATGAAHRSGKPAHQAAGLKLGDPISGTGWGDGSEHTDAVVTPANQESGPLFGGPSGIPGYIPAQLQHNLALTGTGAGQTVAIVDAYDHPYVEDELNAFSKQFGLTQTCDTAAAGSACFDFTVQQMPGMQPQTDNWDMETALDVEWVHAIAPQARIVLVEAAASDNADMYRAVDAAAALNPAAISMSWGGAGEFSGQDYYNGHCELATTVCVEAAGDDGNPAGYGATAPDVLSIGGTEEQLDSSGDLVSQTAWSSGGGGLSLFEARPSYQDGFNPSAFRGAPDVSALASPETGVAVYVAASATEGYWYEVGGTSLATPIWAAVLAATDQDRAAAGKAHLDSADGSIFSAVYGLGTHLLDVTSGSNGPCPASECSAHSGYDTVTGLGSPGPDVDAALAALQ